MLADNFYGEARTANVVVQYQYEYEVAAYRQRGQYLLKIATFTGWRDLEFPRESWTRWEELISLYYSTTRNDQKQYQCTSRSVIPSVQFK